MNQPRIVFCDEPTGNLDSRTAKGIHELFRELNETLRQTFVVVTHEESMALAARHRVFLKDGIVPCGPPEAARPAGLADAGPSEARARPHAGRRSRSATGGPMTSSRTIAARAPRRSRRIARGAP